MKRKESTRKGKTNERSLSLKKVCRGIIMASGILTIEFPLIIFLQNAILILYEYRKNALITRTYNQCGHWIICPKELNSFDISHQRW